MIQIYVLKRPGAEEFIKKASDFYEVVIFTASMSKYANPLLDRLDPRHYATHRLFREHCTFLGSAFVKDLSQLGRDLKDVIIVDNSPASYVYQPANAVPVRTWIDDKSDTQLFELLPILETLSKVHDVRDYLKKVVRNDQINCAQALKILRTEAEVQKVATAEPRAPLMNSWIPQQGRLTTQPAERSPAPSQQSQMLSSSYTVKPESPPARLSATTYRSTCTKLLISVGDRVILPSSGATAKHETATSSKFATREPVSDPYLADYLSIVAKPEAKERPATHYHAPEKKMESQVLQAAHRPAVSFLRQGASQSSSVIVTTKPPTGQTQRARGTPTYTSKPSGFNSTPMNASTSGSHRKVSEEKGPPPRTTYYTNLLRNGSVNAGVNNGKTDRIPRDSSVEKSSPAKKTEERRMSHSVSQPSTGKQQQHYKNNYSIDRKEKEKEKEEEEEEDRVRRELRFDAAATPEKPRFRPGATYTSGFASGSTFCVCDFVAPTSASASLMNVKKTNGTTNYTTPSSTRGYTQTEYMSKTASGGFYAWPERLYPAAKPGEEARPTAQQQSYLSYRERETIATSRISLLSRTGGTYVPYAATRTGLMGYYNY